MADALGVVQAVGLAIEARAGGPGTATSTTGGGDVGADGYPEQRHSGSVGLGPNYRKMHKEHKFFGHKKSADEFNDDDEPADNAHGTVEQEPPKA